MNARIIASLLHRRETGEGEFIDTAQFDTASAFGFRDFVHYANNGTRGPTFASLGTRYGIHKTADAKYVLFAIPEARLWRKFCDALDRADLKRYASDAVMEYVHPPEIEVELRKIALERTMDEWIEWQEAERWPRKRSVPRRRCICCSKSGPALPIFRRAIMTEQSNLPRVISADSHFVEPPAMWAERVDKKFRDRAPRTVRGLDGKDGEYFICENISPFPVTNFFGAGLSPEQRAENSKREMEAAPPSVWDPAARIVDQDRDGVLAEVIYASMGMPLFGLEDVQLRAECFRVFNDWAAEYCRHDFKRLLPLGLLTLEDIGAAVQELQRIAKNGIRGAMIWSEPPSDKPYSHTDYEQFWAAAQEANFPLSLHVLTGNKGTGLDHLKGNLAMQVATLHQAVERSLVDLVLGGVLEKFPRLKIVSAENDVGWIPYLMWRMDSLYSRLAALAPSVKLSVKPSEYIKRQVYATFINEPVFIKTLDVYGPGNAMWSSDYPHQSATWPNSQAFINRVFGTVPETDRRKIVHDTARDLYGIY